MAGIAVGPHGLNIAPKPDALILVGEFGLVLMVLEAGIEVDLNQVALVGARGVAVAFAGSLVPLGIGAGLAKLVFNMPVKSALAVGASLAPTSMGISLKVLQDGGVLSTPTGQLIIAAAVMDDVIALVLLSELEALRDPTPVNFIAPVVSSVCFIVVVGYSAVRIIPKLLVTHLLPRVPKVHLEGVLLGLVFVVAYALMVVLHYGRSSHLLGAFLGGLCFCSLASMQHVWHVQVEKILSWLVRVFFACSIGFEVPIRDLWSGPVLARTGVFLLAGLGKVGTGLFAKPFSAVEAAKIGFAMSAWGEFAFIVATASREAGTLSHEDYSAVVLAVLLSAIYSPFAVKFAIDVDKANKLKRMKSHSSGSSMGLDDPSVGRLDGGEDGFPSARAMSEKQVLHRVYYVSTIHCKSRWGLNDTVLKAIHDASVDLEVLDIAIKPSAGWTMCELFLRDPELRAPLDATLRCQENRVVEEKIPRMQRAIEDAVLPGGGKGGGHGKHLVDGEASRSPTKSSDVKIEYMSGADAEGEVLLARWLPDIDFDEDSDDEADDEIAFKQAEFMLRGGMDEKEAENGENTANDHPGAAEGAASRLAASPASTVRSTNRRAAGPGHRGDRHLIKSDTLRMVHRTGSLMNLKEEGGLQNDMDEELHEAMCEGRLDAANDVSRGRNRMGMGAMREYRAAADEMQARLIERELDHTRGRHHGAAGSRRRLSMGSRPPMTTFPAARSPSSVSFGKATSSGGDGGGWQRPGDAIELTDASTLSGAMGARLASELRASIRPEMGRRGGTSQLSSGGRSAVMAMGAAGGRVRRTSVGAVFGGGVGGGGVQGVHYGRTVRGGGVGGADSSAVSDSSVSASPVVTLTGAGAQRLAMEFREQLMAAENSKGGKR